MAFRRSSPVIALALLPMPGCAGPGLKAGFNAPDPAARLHALEEAVETGDRASIPRLVELLDSSDPAERMLSHRALERLTGRELNYLHSAPEGERRAQIAAIKRELGFSSP